MCRADLYGNTPLYDAVREGHEEAAEVLLEAGARLGLTEVAIATLLCAAAKEVTPGGCRGCRGCRWPSPCSCAPLPRR